jgi:hypothetical protein
MFDDSRHGIYSLKNLGPCEKQIINIWLKYGICPLGSCNF